MHIILHIILHILHIIIDTCCVHCAYCTLYIMHIVHILDEKVIHSLRVFIVYCHCCLVPHPRAQLFTYHHLPCDNHHHCSLIYRIKLQESQPLLNAWRRVPVSLRLPVAPTGTSGRRPSMEDTGITYKLVSVLVHGTRPLSQVGSRRKRCPGQFGQDSMGSIPATPARSMLRAFHQAVCLPLLRFQ
jgi:hypothetical protein